MDNVTHALAGLVTAEAIVQARAFRGHPVSPRLTRTAWVLSAVAHNLPDADGLYAGITPGKLGYLLHHRGHTHTLLLAPALALVSFGLVVGVARLRGVRFGRDELALLGFVALLGPFAHIGLDASNVYGVHPFWPFDSRWVYGDTIFIVEPFFWMVTLPPLLLATRARLGRALLALLFVAGIVLTFATRRVPMPFPFLVVAVAVLVTALALRVGPSARIALALLGSLVVGLVFVVTGRIAESAMRAELASRHPGWVTLDVARSPAPGAPVCFQAIAIQRDDEGHHALRRVSVSLTPSLVPVQRCHPGEEPSTAPLVRGAETARYREASLESSTRALREAAQRCDVAAFLRYARAPFVLEDENGIVVGDLRYDRDPGLGFTELAWPPSPASCPPNVAPWTPPRSDLLGGDRPPPRR